MFSAPSLVLKFLLLTFFKLLLCNGSPTSKSMLQTCFWRTKNFMFLPLVSCHFVHFVYYPMAWNLYQLCAAPIKKRSMRMSIDSSPACVVVPFLETSTALIQRSNFEFAIPSDIPITLLLSNSASLQRVLLTRHGMPFRLPTLGITAIRLWVTCKLSLS